MKTFHSSGTAAEGRVMWRWNAIIPIAASQPIVPPLERSRIAAA
jgi:hypothetical protein